MNTQTTTLPNNLRVVTAAMPGSYSATLMVAVGVGSRYENFEQNGGISHFLEHLMFKGTKRRPSTKIISEQIDAVGGFTNAYTSNEQTSYYVKIPYQHVQLGLDILADMLQHSLLDPDEIDRERGVVLEEMNVSRDDPARFVHRLTPDLLWPDHPLANDVLGDPKVIRDVSKDEIAKFHRSYYRPGSMVVAAAGRVDHEHVVKLAEHLFGGLKDAKIKRSPRVRKVLDSQLTAALEKDTAQTHLNISTVSYPVDHPDQPAARLIAAILGEGLSSRLFLNVRERLGLAYSVFASNDSYTDSGEFTVYAGVNHEKAELAIGAILDELQTIRQTAVPTAELNKAKNQIRGGLQMAMEGNNAVADHLSTQLLLRGSIRTVEETLAEIDAVSTNDITRVANYMLRPQRLRLGVISPDPVTSVAAFTKIVNK